MSLILPAVSPARSEAYPPETSQADLSWQMVGPLAASLLARVERHQQQVANAQSSISSGHRGRMLTMKKRAA